MSNIFYRTRVQSEPGAKLYFFASETSDPQNTYQDIDLTTAHSHPVVADAEGYFDTIYLDPALGNYRYTLTDADDVVLEGPIDDYPASANQSTRYRVKGTAPDILFEETDASSDNKIWRIKVESEVMTIDAGDDAESSWTNLLTLTRTTNLITTGSFTGTLSGMSGATTGTISYTKIGSTVVLFTDTQISGTSDSTSMSLTGMPAAIVPKQGTEIRYSMCNGLLDDNGVISADVSLSFPVSSWVFDFLPSGGFTNSGVKGLAAGFTLIYRAW